MIEDRNELEAHIRSFAADCAVKLRAQHGVCAQVGVFVSTNRHRDDLPQYINGAMSKLVTPTADTPIIVKAAVSLFGTLFRNGYRYKQAGVTLANITEETGLQLDLFSAPEDEKRRKIMKITDEINAKFGLDKVHFS